MNPENAGIAAEQRKKIAHGASRGREIINQRAAERRNKAVPKVSFVPVDAS